MVVLRTVNKKRPVNLDLTSIRFPVPAIASILHRVSGMALFVATPLLLWMLERSLDSAEAFAALKATLDGFLVKLVLLAVLAGLLYHLAAGIRHLLMDMHIGDTLEGGRRGAWSAIAVAAVATLLMGVWLW